MSANQLKFETTFEQIFKQDQYKFRKIKKQPFDLKDGQEIPNESDHPS